MINNVEQELYAKEKLDIWPLDESNVALLNEVHPYGYKKSTDTTHVSLLLSFVNYLLIFFLRKLLIAVSDFFYIRIYMIL